MTTSSITRVDRAPLPLLIQNAIKSTRYGFQIQRLEVLQPLHGISQLL
jgi:hypothetical protein